MGFFDTLLGRSTRNSRSAPRAQRPASANVAKQRLVEVLVQDHVKLTPDALEAMRIDIIKVVSRHLDVDAERLQINITRGERGESLVANVPVRRGGVTQRR